MRLFAKAREMLKKDIINYTKLEELIKSSQVITRNVINDQNLPDLTNESIEINLSMDENKEFSEEIHANKLAASRNTHVNVLSKLSQDNLTNLGKNRKSKEDIQPNNNDFELKRVRSRKYSEISAEEEIKWLETNIIFKKGNKSKNFVLILSGKVEIYSGRENFMSIASSFTPIGQNALLKANYVPDFTAVVVEATKYLQISFKSYQNSIN